MFICIGIPKHLTTFFSSGTKRLLTSWVQSFDTRREKYNFYYADRSIWPNKRAAHPVGPNWTGHAQAQKSTSLPQVQISTRLAQRQILTTLVQRHISTNCFFQKSPEFSAHRFRAWRHSHPSLISYLGVFIMIFVIIRSSAREREHQHSMCAPARALRADQF